MLSIGQGERGIQCLQCLRFCGFADERERVLGKFREDIGRFKESTAEARMDARKSGIIETSHRLCDARIPDEP